ncbi:MAG: hypothetical protein GX996_02940 [Firmicutes bacterium]|nr:hypothetical protein [Bacillota bacterium]
MVRIVKSFEQKMMGRLFRRGYSEEECEKILAGKSRIGDVTVLNKRSFGQHSLRDFVKINSC